MLLCSLAFSGFMEIGVIICFFSESTFCCIFSYCFYHSEQQFSRLYCRTVLPYCKAKRTQFQEGPCNLDKASRRALIKSRLTSVHFQYKETTDCPEPYHMQIQSTGLLIVITVFLKVCFIQSFNLLYLFVDQATHDLGF